MAQHDPADQGIRIPPPDEAPFEIPRGYPTVAPKPVRYGRLAEGRPSLPPLPVSVQKPAKGR